MVQFFELNFILFGEVLTARLACGSAKKAQENVGEGKRIKAAVPTKATTVDLM